MNETVQLLQDVIRNARTGESAIDQLLTISDNTEMRKDLMTEKAFYHSTVRTGEQALIRAGGKPEPVGPMAKAGMKMGIMFNTITDKSDCHIAEMVIQGANMGIVEMTKALNTYPNANEDALSIARNFIGQQQDIINRQKHYLVDKVNV